MPANPLTTRLFVCGLVLGMSVPALADDDIPTDSFPSGGPQPGVDVPLRVRNLDDSRRHLDVGSGQGDADNGDDVVQGSGTNPYRDILNRRDALRGAEGDEGGEGETRRPPGSRFVFDQPGDRGTTAAPRDPRLMYQGIVPGVRDRVEHIPSPAGAAAPRLEWFGVQFERPDVTRVAVRIPASVRHQITQERGGAVLRLRLSGTELGVHPNHRSVDARYFGRALQRVGARRVGQDVEITIELAQRVNHRVTREGEFLLIDIEESRQP